MVLPCMSFPERVNAPPGTYPERGVFILRLPGKRWPPAPLVADDPGVTGSIMSASAREDHGYTRRVRLGAACAGYGVTVHVNM
jgi:hypothetical protein